MINENNEKDSFPSYLDFIYKEQDFDDLIDQASKNYQPSDYNTIDSLVDVKEQFNDLFVIFYNRDFNFKYGTFNSYKEYYRKNTEIFIKKYKDADEVDFINSELIRLESIVNIKGFNINRYKFTETNFRRIEFSNNKIIKLLGEKLKLLTQENEDGQTTELQSKEFVDSNKRFKTNFNQIQFLELVKALIENGNITGNNQQHIIEDLSKLLDVEINLKTINQQIQGIHKRNTDTHTKFLKELEQSLKDWIERIGENKENNL